MAAYLYECRCRGTCYCALFFNRCVRIAASEEPDAMPGKTKFVAGFTQCEFDRFYLPKTCSLTLPLANVGDTSPNT